MCILFLCIVKARGVKKNHIPALMENWDRLHGLRARIDIMADVCNILPRKRVDELLIKLNELKCLRNKDLTVLLPAPVIPMMLRQTSSQFAYSLPESRNVQNDIGLRPAHCFDDIGGSVGLWDPN
jgi:hypothetical protein